jgi:LEA14-like dessication related protein
MKILFLLTVPTVLLLSCASPAPVQPTVTPVPQSFSALPEAPPPPPKPLPRPSSRLTFDGLEAESIDRCALYYQLQVDNPRTGPLRLDLTEARILVNGTHTLPVTSLTPQTQDHAESIGVNASATNAIRLRLDLDLSRVPPDCDDYATQLTLCAAYRYENGEVLTETLSCDALFPRVREPQLFVTSITVSQAELINTRLKVTLRIDNPNPFPVELSALSYQLYGENRFWAQGNNGLSLPIPANGSASTNVALVMNFIDMPRGMLDSVVAMREIDYRFAGETTVAAPIAYLPSFHLAFDLSGTSAVVQ